MLLRRGKLLGIAASVLPLPLAALVLFFVRRFHCFYSVEYEAYFFASAFLLAVGLCGIAYIMIQSASPSNVLVGAGAPSTPPKAFTLSELLIVMTVLGMIMAMAIPNLIGGL